MVIDLIKHDILKSYTTVGCLDVILDSFKEFFKWEWAVNTHDAWTKVIVGRVKWYGEVNLNTFVGKFLNFWCQTRCWHSNVTRSDSKTIVIVNSTQETKHIVIVIKWLTDTHNNHVADTFTIATVIKVLLYQHDLSNNLTSSQVTLFLNQTTGTESTTDVTSNLSCHTDRQTIVLTHQNRLNQHTVRQFKKILNCTIFRFLNDTLFQWVYAEILIQLGNEIFRNVGHFFERLYTLLVEPIPNLSRTEFLFTVFHSPVNQLITSQTINRRFVAFHIL